MQRMIEENRAGAAVHSVFALRLCHVAAAADGFAAEDIPTYSGEPYVEIDGNVPDFPEEDQVAESFESYALLDFLGRCGTAYACISTDLMPTEERGSIGQVKPSGWQTVKYEHAI